MSHSDGPWCLDNLGNSVFTDSKENLGIAIMMKPNIYVEVPSEKERKANARLIAAAPEMIYALEEVEGLCDNNPRVREIVKNAIKKARGEQ